MTTYTVGEVIHIEGDLTPCDGCGDARARHRYVVVSATKMGKDGCDGPDRPGGHCSCPGFRAAGIEPAPPSREDTWTRFPDDAEAILDQRQAPATRCGRDGCRAEIWWGVTRANSKRCPFDIRPDGSRTGTSHWRTCRDRPAPRRART